MSRVAALLTAAAAKLAAAKRPDDSRLFRTVRAELDRYDFADLTKDKAAAPFARVCLLRAKPLRRSDGGIDQDVSVAIVVVAGREGRPNPAFSSEDIAALGLIDAVTAELMADPYVGLTGLQAADIGDGLVVLSGQSNEAGLCIALLEVKWRLLETHIARPAIQRALETGREPLDATQVAIGDRDPEPPRAPGHLWEGAP